MISNTAVFIDFENVRIRLEELSPSADVDDIDFISKLDKILKDIEISNINYFVYDDFENKYYSRNNILSRYGAQGIVTKNVLCAKDSADIQLCLDAYELCIKDNIDTFVIVSSDRDMFPLIKKLKLNYKRVFLVGLTFNASNHVIKYVDRFIPIESIINREYDKNYIIKKDIIDATKRVKDLYDWSYGKHNDLEKKFLFNALRAKLYETTEYTQKIYNILVSKGIIEEYTYNYKDKPFTGIKFILNEYSKTIINDSISNFYE